jgi:hypothetical protein
LPKESSKFSCFPSNVLPTERDISTRRAMLNNT